MTIPLCALEVWAEAIASPHLVRTGATRHMVPLDTVVDLDHFGDCDWPDAGFTAGKLRYLQRRYPPDRLPRDGCIASLDRTGGSVLYRRVDVTRGWLADVLYLRHLGWRGLCRFRGPGTLHAVNASAVSGAVWAADLWRGAAPALARTLGRAVLHRLARVHERRAATARVNEWAHRISTSAQMAGVVEALERQLGLSAHAGGHE